MDFFVGVSTTNLYAAISIAVLLLLLALFRTQRIMREESPQVTNLQRDLRLLCNAAVNMGRRINQLESHLQEQSKRQEVLDIKQSQLEIMEQNDYSVEKAIKMVRKGATADDLVETLSIPYGEAELLAMIYRFDKAG